MRAIYTRTIGVYDEKLGEAIWKSLKAWQKLEKNIIQIMKFTFHFKVLVRGKS